MTENSMSIEALKKRVLISDEDKLKYRVIKRMAEREYSLKDVSVMMKNIREVIK